MLCSTVPALLCPAYFNRYLAIGTGVFRLFLAIRSRDARGDVRRFVMKRSVAEKGTRIGGE
jgi:hypothetical protein